MTLQPVLHSFAHAVEYLREQVANVSAEDLVAQPAGVVNHPAWVIGHLTLAYQEIGAVLGLAAWLPDGWGARFGTGSRPLADAALHPEKDRALAMLRDARERVARRVERLDEAALAAPFPDSSFRDVFPTVRHALVQVLVGHPAYHVGQVGGWRRAMGLPAVQRRFE